VYKEDHHWTLFKMPSLPDFVPSGRVILRISSSGYIVSEEEVCILE
jgi:hypothetical protein